MNLDLHCVGALDSVCADDVGPEHAGSTELGDLEEVVAADGEGELDALCDLGCIETSVGKGSHVLAADGHAVAELLADAAAGCVEIESLDGHYADVGILGDSLDAICELVISVIAEMALDCKSVQRAEIEACADLVFSSALSGGHLEEAVDDAAGLAGAAAAEVDLDGLEADVLQQDSHLFLIKAFVANLEAD